MMGDMLVRLYDLPDNAPIKTRMREQNIEIRRPLPFESRIVIKWVEDIYGPGWAMQAEAAFFNTPISCFIAVREKKMIGFAAYDATCRNFFGPTAVDEKCRGKGIGKALLLAALYAMKHDGYAYAIIGGAGPVDFYKKALAAVEIEGSAPGIYANRIDR
jgi:GNAT superfamily N-acetyltransferase